MKTLELATMPTISGPCATPAADDLAPQTQGGRTRRWHPILRGALCFLLLPVPTLAQISTTVSPALPSLGDTEKNSSDPDTIYCRPPQHQTDSRLLGPKVCLPNRQWEKLHAQGLDISADGKHTVASEKYNSLNLGACRLGGIGNC